MNLTKVTILLISVVLAVAVVSAAPDDFIPFWRHRPDQWGQNPVQPYQGNFNNQDYLPNPPGPHNHHHHHGPRRPPLVPEIEEVIRRYHEETRRMIIDALNGNRFGFSSDPSTKPPSTTPVTTPYPYMLTL